MLAIIGAGQSGVVPLENTDLIADFIKNLAEADGTELNFISDFSGRQAEVTNCFLGFGDSLATTISYLIFLSRSWKLLQV
jgi:hypothetical protein